jgi:transcriptional regulator with XRE-family HTH domain
MVRTEDLIMSDKSEPAPLLGFRIRELRCRQGWTLTELARRAGTSPAAMHRYESGWGRFEIRTLRRIAAVLEARVEVRLLTAEASRADVRGERDLVRRLRSVFWDRDLEREDLDRHADWVLARVLVHGTMDQAAAARTFYGDDRVREVLRRRDVDARTRTFWIAVLGEESDASARTRD